MLRELIDSGHPAYAHVQINEDVLRALGAGAVAVTVMEAGAPAVTEDESTHLLVYNERESTVEELLSGKPPPVQDIQPKFDTPCLDWEDLGKSFWETTFPQHFKYGRGGPSDFSELTERQWIQHCMRYHDRRSPKTGSSSSWRTTGRCASASRSSPPSPASARAPNGARRHRGRRRRRRR